MTTNDFLDLVGEELSGVTFVRDYLKLQFNPPTLMNVLTPVTVMASSQQASSGEPAFANLLIGQIDKAVSTVEFAPAVCLTIVFEDGSVIRISLLEDDYPGPEAINFFRRNGSLLVL